MHLHEDSTREEGEKKRRHTSGGEKEKEASEKRSENEWDTLRHQEEGDWRHRGKTNGQFLSHVLLIHNKNLKCAPIWHPVSTCARGLRAWKPINLFNILWFHGHGSLWCVNCGRFVFKIRCSKLVESGNRILVCGSYVAPRHAHYSNKAWSTIFTLG